METGLQPHWSETIRAWATGQPLVLEVHAFGSRVKGGYRTDSDLDLAFVVDGQDEGEQLGNAICLLPAWRAELQALLPVKVHAQSMFDDDVVVAPAVREHGMLVFRRDGVTSPDRGSGQEGSEGR
ncbi:nucleotidyltransferase family protein [Sphingomonas corticis]|uniref:Nucleotidyltransferase domain-containing protein n=1 Tax=Sphingomonas corticis TaxID=2722791 RepID=A0ABX1CQV1_9SPHN|nr:nucleotidyltransferase domain-containing protein [Sphingomonas corticis]NJR80325.1 nucleotidyltransferase domain-containing protein [Sphingomonas corticis]